MSNANDRSHVHIGLEEPMDPGAFNELNGSLRDTYAGAFMELSEDGLDLRVFHEDDDPEFLIQLALVIAEEAGKRCPPREEMGEA